MALPDILILGGYGEAGIAIARHLLSQTKCNVVLAGRNIAAAGSASADINHKANDDRVSARQCDASDPASLAAALTGIGLVVNCLPHAGTAVPVVEAAIEAEADVLDILYGQAKVPLLQALAPRLIASGRCCITEAGIHPGLPSALVRYVAPRFQRFRSATLGLAINEPIPYTSGMLEVAEEALHGRPKIYRDGAWRDFPTLRVPTMDFGKPIGRRPIYPINLEEMRALPQQFGLEQAGVYVAGLGVIADTLMTLPSMLLEWLHRGWGVAVLARMMSLCYSRMCTLPRGCVMKIEAEGEDADGPFTSQVSVGGRGGYDLTAIATVACILQYLEGRIGPGLHMMGHATDPARLLRDMERMGACVEEGPV